MTMSSSKFLFRDHHHALAGFLSAVTDIGGAFAALIERQRQRRALARLDDHLLRDIGLSADIAHAETKRPFWR